jgi:hypothetical protein
MSSSDLSETGGGSVTEGEIYTRADGKKVRRVKRATSASAQGNTKTLEGFLSSGSDKGESKLSKLSGSRSVGGEGDIYIRADGKKGERRDFKKTDKK